jgi:hypothetical protein
MATEVEMRTQTGGMTRLLCRVPGGFWGRRFFGLWLLPCLLFLIWYPEWLDARAPGGRTSVQQQQKSPRVQQGTTAAQPRTRKARNTDTMESQPQTSADAPDPGMTTARKSPPDSHGESTKEGGAAGGGLTPGRAPDSNAPQTAGKAQKSGVRPAQPSGEMLADFSPQQIVAVAAAAIALLALIAGYWIWAVRRQAFSRSRTARTPGQRNGFEPLDPADERRREWTGRPNEGAARSDAPEREWLEGALRNVEAMQRQAQSELLKRFDQVEYRLNGLENALPELKRCYATLQEAGTVELESARARIDSLEDRLRAMEDAGRRQTAEVLAALAGSVLQMPVQGPGASGETLAARLEATLGKLLQDSAPDPAEIRPLLERAARLQEAVAEFRRTIARVGATEDGGVDRLLEDISRVRADLESLEELAKGRRLRYTFTVEAQARQDVRQPFLQSIAAGIGSQLSKLANVKEYYGMQLLHLAGRAAADCADLADGRIDVERKTPEIQQSLKSIFAAGGLTEISPNRNDAFSALEHTVLHTIRRNSSSDRSRAVAGLLARGFRQGNRVIRKATVLLYD